MSGENHRARLVGDKYEIERHLATGGMGELYVARHVLTTQRVALKVLDRRLARNDASIERFLREVRLGAKIGHPAIVTVFDAGLHVSEEGPVPFLAMELLEGCNLAQRIARGDVTQARALTHIAALLEPLVAAHAKGVVHRDLKPENVFIERLADGAERVRLLDLGIARDAAEAGKATLAGQALGTVYYMAPEQSLDARSATPVSDVWSLGAMLYQCLSGEFPFDGETAAAVILRACRDPHRPLIEVAPHVDPRLASLVDRCLSKDLLNRPGDAGALRDELAPLLADPAVYDALDAHLVVTWSFQSPDPAPHEDPFAAQPEAPTPASALASLRAFETPSSLRSDTRPSAASSAPPDATTSEPAPAPRSRRALALLALALPVVAGLAWLTLRAPAPRPTATSPSALAAPSRVAPAPVADPVAPVAIPVAPVANAPVLDAPVAAIAAQPATTRPRRRTAADPTPAQAAPSTEAQPPAPQPPAPVAAIAEPPAVVRNAPALAAPTPVVASHPPVASPPVAAPPVARPAQPAAPPPAPDFVTF